MCECVCVYLHLYALTHTHTHACSRSLSLIHTHSLSLSPSFTHAHKYMITTHQTPKETCFCVYRRLKYSVKKVNFNLCKVNLCIPVSNCLPCSLAWNQRCELVRRPKKERKRQVCHFKKRMDVSGHHRGKRGGGTYSSRTQSLCTLLQVCPPTADRNNRVYVRQET